MGLELILRITAQTVEVKGQLDLCRRQVFARIGERDTILEDIADLCAVAFAAYADDSGILGGNSSEYTMQIKNITFDYDLAH